MYIRSYIVKRAKQEYESEVGSFKDRVESHFESGAVLATSIVVAILATVALVINVVIRTLDLAEVGRSGTFGEVILHPTSITAYIVIVLAAIIAISAPMISSYGLDLFDMRDFSVSVFISPLIALMSILVAMLSFGITFSANQDKVIDVRVEMLTDYGYENVVPFEDFNSKYQSESDEEHTSNQIYYSSPTRANDDWTEIIVEEENGDIVITDETKLPNVSPPPEKKVIG